MLSCVSLSLINPYPLELLKKEDVWAVVRVRDTGVGISSHHLPHVFERFYRVDPARSAHSGGVGLGLSLVKGIMTLHGGRVEIESQPGVGTVVKLWFPIS